MAPLSTAGRRAQMEMIGVVFVVVILILGIVLYMAFSGPGRSTATPRSHGTSSFLTALGQTYVPQCHGTVTDVARECRLGNSRFCGGNPCGKLNHTFAVLLDEADYPEQHKYDLHLAGTSVRNASRCDSINPRENVTLVSNIIIPLGNGGSTNLTLALCR